MATVVTVSGKGSPLTATEMDANFSNLNTDKLDDAPSDGTQYIRKNGSWANLVADSFVETASTKPSNPIDGQPWFSESNGVTYVYSGADGVWVAVGSSSLNSGVNTFRAMRDTNHVVNNRHMGLAYRSTPATWGFWASDLNNAYFGRNSSFLDGSVKVLAEGWWLVQVHMSIGTGTYTTSAFQPVYADIKLETQDRYTESVYTTQNPLNTSDGVTLGGDDVDHTVPQELTWFKLIPVATTYVLRATSTETNRSGDMAAEITCQRIGGL